LGELETGPVLEYMGKQRQNCRDHTNRMAGGRIPKQILQNAPRGRNIGRQAQRWLETVTDHMIQGSVSQTFFKWGPLSLVRMFYGPPYSWDYQTH